LPAPIHCGPSSKLFQLTDPQIDARFEDRRIECHDRSLNRRWRVVDTIDGG
jgi:hypothetical protein